VDAVVLALPNPVQLPQCGLGPGSISCNQNNTGAHTREFYGSDVSDSGRSTCNDDDFSVHDAEV